MSTISTIAHGRIDMTALELLQYPFMQRALLAGLMLGVLLASLGVFVMLRRMACFGEGIAHASLAGIAIAVVAGLSPLPVAMIYALIIGLFIYWLERYTRLSSDAAIGILFTASMALGVVLMSFTSGYQPELLSFLFGSILSVRTLDLILIASVSAVTLFWLFKNIKQLTYMSLNEESATVSGVKTHIHVPVLYALLSVATVLGVKILGIILVSALLILPPATSRLLTASFKGYVIGSIIVAEAAIILGLISSLVFDLPSGATIVLAGSVLFLIGFVIRRKA